MLAGAAYDPTRVAVGTSAVHTGNRHNQDPLGAGMHQEPHLAVSPGEGSGEEVVDIGSPMVVHCTA